MALREKLASMTHGKRCMHACMHVDEEPRTHLKRKHIGCLSNEPFNIKVFVGREVESLELLQSKHRKNNRAIQERKAHLFVYTGSDIGQDDRADVLFTAHKTTLTYVDRVNDVIARKLHRTPHNARASFFESASGVSVSVGWQQQIVFCLSGTSCFDFDSNNRSQGNYW